MGMEWRWRVVKTGNLWKDTWGTCGCDRGHDGVGRVAQCHATLPLIVPPSVTAHPAHWALIAPTACAVGSGRALRTNRVGRRDRFALPNLAALDIIVRATPATLLLLRPPLRAAPHSCSTCIKTFSVTKQAPH